MSLKSFHIVFIACSTLLAFGLAAWAFQSYLLGGPSLLLAAGGGSLLVGAGLILYGIRFLRKLKGVSFL